MEMMFWASTCIVSFVGGVVYKTRSQAASDALFRAEISRVGVDIARARVTKQEILAWMAWASSGGLAALHGPNSATDELVAEDLVRFLNR